MMKKLKERVECSSSEKQFSGKPTLCLLILFIQKFFFFLLSGQLCENSHNLFPPSTEKVAPLFSVNLTLHLTELNM